jgi:hypothetical protein
MLTLMDKNPDSRPCAHHALQHEWLAELPEQVSKNEVKRVLSNVIKSQKVSGENAIFTYIGITVA